MEVTIVVATFGGDEWRQLAAERAIPSAEAQGVPVVHHHGETLHGARNDALDLVDTEWVLYLDADDELEPGFIDAMSAGTADVRAPSVRYVRGRRPRSAWVPMVAGHAHTCTAECLLEGNWLVVGSLVRAEMIRAVGGWRDFIWSEDWDLWLRCHLAGATIEAIPAAVYKAYVRPQSRNRSADQATRARVHREILDANGLAA